MRSIWILGVVVAMVVLGAVTAGAHSVPTGNVITCLPFDETTGTVYDDKGSLGHDGSYCDRGVNADECPTIDASSATAAGQLGTAMSFINTIGGMTYNSLIDVPVPSVSLPTANDSFAVSFWMKQPVWAGATGVAVPPAYGPIATYYDTTSAFGWTVGLDPHNTNYHNTVCVSAKAGGVVVSASIDVDALANDSYHHFLFQFEPNTEQLGQVKVSGMYLDGLAASEAGNAGWNMPSVDSLVLGARDPNTQFPIRSGTLDDFAIVNGVVTPANVGNIMTGNYTGLTRKLHYTLDETTGSTITDSSGNGNNATLHGFSVYHPYDVSKATVAGQLGNAVKFTPDTTTYTPFARIAPSTTDVQAGQPFTVMFWANPTGHWNDNGVIVTDTVVDGTDTATFGYSIGLYNGSGTADGLIVRTTDFAGPGADKLGGVNLIGTGTGGLAALTEGQFAHFAVVIDADGTVSKIYVNGNLVTQDILNSGWDIRSAFAGTFLGGRRSSSNVHTYEMGTPLNGTVDDFGVILGQLSQSQIQEAMASGLASLIGAIPGDANCDDVVNDLDAQRLAENWGATALVGQYTWWEMGDFNGDHTVNAADAAIQVANWGVTGEGIGVPEPGSLVLLLGALAALAAGRRKRD